LFLLFALTRIVS